MDSAYPSMQYDLGGAQPGDLVRVYWGMPGLDVGIDEVGILLSVRVDAGWSRPILLQGAPRYRDVRVKEWYASSGIRVISSVADAVDEATVDVPIPLAAEVVLDDAASGCIALPILVETPEPGAPTVGHRAHRALAG